MNNEEKGWIYIFEGKMWSEKFLIFHLPKELQCNYVNVLFKDVE